MSRRWDEEFDVVVVGSGAGALVAALTATLAGLSCVLLEKTEYFGGTTAYSGGGMWLPNNPVLGRAGVRDSFEAAKVYLDRAVGDRTSFVARDAYLLTGPKVIEFLENDPNVEFVYDRGYPEYHPDFTGSVAEGRTIMPCPISPTMLGEDLALLRPPLVPGGGEGRQRSPADAAGRTDLIKGQALIARLLLACRAAGVDLRTRSALAELIRDGKSVVGVLADTAAGTNYVRARRGVILAAGGFERNPAMRARYLPAAVAHSRWTIGNPGNTGEVVRAAEAVGCALDLMDDCWWTPGFVRPGGSVAFVIAERLYPGSIMVNSSGQRYANESLPYNELGQIMKAHAMQRVPSHLIADHHYFDRYPFCGAAPESDALQGWLAAGTVTRADTLEALAVAIGLDPAALKATVDQFNTHAIRGHDPDFGRGEGLYERQLLAKTLGNMSIAPDTTLANPCLAPLTTGPFYAAELVLADIGTKGGIVCDEHAGALDHDGNRIEGLYAAGNSMASVMGNAYPAPGSTIGPSVVFGYLAALDIARQPETIVSPVSA